jgi:hypothetical protein
MKKVILAAVAAVAVSAALPEVSSARPPAESGSKPKPPPKKKTYKGTILMECRDVGGKLVCKPISDRVMADSEAEARRELRKKLEFKARAEEGRLVGEVVLTIEF